MKNNKKIILSLVIILAVIFTSITAFNIFRKSDVEEDKEILRSKNYAQVEYGDEKITGTDYVTFDAYYLRDLDGDGYAEKLRGTCREIGAQDTLYMDLNVLTNGTLKNGKITINGQNFYFATALVKDSVVSQDYISSNTKQIVLNDVVNGTQKLIFGIVKSGDYKYASEIATAIGNNSKNYNRTDNTIVLTGTHVADDGTETAISKTVKLTNDWYGTTSARLYSIYRNQRYDINSAIDNENQKLILGFKVCAIEDDKKLLIARNHVEGELPLINGHAPINVTTTNPSATVTYDEETRVFEVETVAQTNSSGVIASTIARTLTYEIKAEYPLEAYTSSGEDTVSITVPVKSYFDGFNNTNEEFENPYQSNLAEDVLSITYSVPEGEAARIDVDLGKWTNYRGYIISKELPLNTYNQVEVEEQKADRYTVRWYAYTGTSIENTSLKLKETPENYTDKFLDTDGNYIDMLRYIKNVGIYFSNPEPILGEDGYINVYNDETNELLHTFTKDDWSSYSSSKPYMYESGVSHIRVETSNVTEAGSITCYNVKEIDDVLLTAEYTEEDFNKLIKIYSYLTGYLNVNGTESKINSDTDYAYYDEPQSLAEISIDSNYMTNQETRKNSKITIETITTQYNTKKWQNGEFLIKYPEEIIDVNINSITPSDSSVTISGIDTYEENGNIYTKIYTSNNVEKQVKLTIDADITADPRGTTVSNNLELYYYNPICHNYINKTSDVYDINGNSNVDENIGYDSFTLDIIAPSNLLTAQTATDFDDKASVTVAPQEATIDKLDGSRTAKVNVNITNNYSSTVSEIKIVGKIPFEGNTYQLNKTDLGSMFDTTMTEEGIVVPEELKDSVTVYYSEKENVTEDINAKKNAWTTTPEDMSKVKSYLIDLGNYVMPVENTKTFTYTIQIPSGVNYNDVAYSAHAIYYCLDTDQGKLTTQTEPNKLGFRIAEKYDLELTKYVRNTIKPIQGVVFSAQEVGTEEAKSAVTYADGIATIKNLYVEKEYVVKEIKTTENYVLDETETKIIGHVVDGELQIEVLEGGFTTEPTVELVENANTKVKAVVENEVKYNFVLNKTLTGTDETIQGIRFELTDYNGITKRYTTNKDGQLTIKLLEPNKQYILTEVESKGHYLKDTISFMMVRDENDELKFNVLAGDLDTLPVIDETGEIPVVTTGLSNEKIPTYSLRITKKETDTETTLAGAQFKLTGENKKDSVLYTTDENGVVQIDGLYQYVEGKDITGEYTLQEIYPSEGYVLNNTPILFKAQKDATDSLKLEIISGTIREAIEDVQVDSTDPDNPIINITIDNEPVFTLTKVDAETGEPLGGVEFEIRDLNDNYVRDANGELIGFDEVSKIEFTSTGDYPWTKNDDGTWQSGNYNIASSTSTLTSNEFKIEGSATLSFDWSVSSQSTVDYLYYTITNIDTSKTIGGTSTRISGTSYGDAYNYLTYHTKEIVLDAGTYKIEFKYYKNSSTNTGLDMGFVKNIALYYDKEPLKTASDGKIRVSLLEGLYKAIETKTLQGYVLPELYTGIGIGKSKNATTSYEIEWEKSLKAKTLYDMVVIEDSIYTCGAGIISKFDINGNLIWENEELIGSNFMHMVEVRDGVVAVSETGEVIKLDFDGNIVWKNAERAYNYDVVVAGENAIFGVVDSGQVVMYDLVGNTVWENYEKEYEYTSAVCVNDGIITLSGEVLVKYDFSGNIVWEKLNENEVWVYNAILVDDYIIGSTTGGGLVKFDLDGNFIWKTGLLSVKNQKWNLAVVDNEIILVGEGLGGIIKCDFEGNKTFSTDEYEQDLEAIDSCSTGFIVIASDAIISFDFDGNILWNNANYTNWFDDQFGIAYGNGLIVTTDNDFVKCYDLSGNIVWTIEETVDVTPGKEVIYTENGFVVIGKRGGIIKADLNGNIIWRNSEKNYSYYSGTKLEDDSIVAVSHNGQVVKYDSNGNLVWENTDKQYDYYTVSTVKDGIIAASYKGQVVKYDFDGNILWESTEKSYNYIDSVPVQDGIVVLSYTGAIVRYDSNGNVLWEISKFTAKSHKIMLVENEIVALSGSGLTKYDLNGNELLYKKSPYSYLQDFVEIEDGIIVTSSTTLRGFIKFKQILTDPEIAESTNLIVENEIAKYKVTTKVDGTGGTISGENEDIYEEVKYKEDSIKDIIVTPDEGYKIASITVNGKSIFFEENLEGVAKLEKFTSVTEDKEVIVIFANKNKSLIINKQDSITLNPLENAIFNIKQLEIRDEPASEQIVGEIVANGTIHYENGTELESVLGSVTSNNDIYYFVDNGNGGYESNNQGQANATAKSYVTVDLRNYEGKYNVVVNANVSSQSYDYGYATITNSDFTPGHTVTTNRFIYISGTGTSVTTAKDYSIMLDGGQLYYLHLGYYKNGSTDTGDDKFTVNSIKVYNTVSSTYNFIDNGNGGYESNNQGQANKVANSYIPIDLTGYKGQYNLIVNANVSSQSSDYGYATITEDTIAPAFNNATNRFIYISGTSTSVTKAKDYSTIIEGGKIYYLHLGYYKNAFTDSGDDKFTVNSISLTLNDEDFVDEYIATNSSGYAKIELEDWQYQITEVEAPEGYTLDSTPIIYDFVAGQENIITVTNDPQVDLIVHHYLKDTTTSVAPDETIKGDLGKEYSTTPKMDLGKYQLVKNEDGSYQIPDNATGIVTEETQVITYYYELAPLQLVVHHYIDGTEDKLVADEIIEGYQGDTYTTNALEYPTLASKYEIVTDKLPENANGTFEGSSIEVTYYYRLKEFNIITAVDGNGGTISGQQDKVYEIVQYGKSSTKEILITPNEKYQIKSITINGVEQTLPKDKTEAYTLPAITNVTEEKNVIVIFEIETIDYSVTKVWNDESNSLSKRPESVEIQLYNGSKLVGSKTISEDNPKLTPPAEIKFSQMSETYPWSQNADGTWQSGNFNVNSTTSTLTSDTFEVLETQNLNFDWSVSSESSTSDYLYYTITNVDTGGTIGGSTNNIRIGGSSYGTVYENLSFKSVSVSLEPGIYTITFTYRKDGSVHKYLDSGYVKNVSLTKGVPIENTWEAVFEDVPMYDESGNVATYTAVLKETNTNDLHLYESAAETTSTYTSEIVSTFSIPEDKIDIKVVNNWVDESNANSKRPAQVKLQLKNGDTILQEQVVDTTENQQVYTFIDLAEYDSSGNEIAYTVDIAEVNTDDLKFYSKAIDNTTYTITNTFTVPEDKVEVTVTTNWTDNDNENNVRPTQITLKAMNGDTLVQDKVVDVTADNTQTYIFSDLPKYDEHGDEITYTIAQEDITGYDKVIEGTTVTNTIKSYNVSVNENPEGGTISEVTETVTHGGSTTQDIIATPDEGYQISKITVNGVEQTLPENQTQAYTLAQITNVAEDVEIVVEFEKIPYTITISGNTEGGTISESDEIVRYGEDSTKDIVITPADGYEIGSITINGEELEFTPNEDGTYTLPKFTNVTESKEVIVTFEYSITSVLVKYVDQDGTELAESVTIDGKVNDDYTTEALEFSNYDLKETPANAIGTMTKEQIIVTYEYTLVKGKITITKVDNTDNTILLSGATFKLEKLNDEGNVDTTFTAVEKTTDDTGTVEFNELLVGNYKVTETVAPEGYQLAINSVDVEISKLSREQDLVIKNKTKVVLPLTGSVNYTIIASVIGISLMVVVLGIKKLKKF